MYFFPTELFTSLPYINKKPILQSDFFLLLLSQKEKFFFNKISKREKTLKKKSYFVEKQPSDI